ncbi:MAG: hypothetical protein ACREJX_03135 [Polyangiaceae bacterium]
MLAKYTKALEAVKLPPAYTCGYTVSHQGAAPVETEHQLFREAGRERDEIIAYNGEKLSHPEVRIFARRRDPYAVTFLAPRLSEYTFTYVEAVRHGRTVNYVFKTAAAHGTPNYEVTRVTVDGASFLPLEIVFRAKRGTTIGTGRISYEKADRFWMPTFASARAQVNGLLETERIDWTRYQFYPSLPPSTFAAPSRGES